MSSEPQRLWIFGYGSLIWRPDFPSDAEVSGWLHGWRRGFWQGSEDHRGRPGAPGRVVTLLPHEDSRCWGVCRRVAEGEEEAILRRLDHREQGGYVRELLPVHGEDGCVRQALIYRASPDNPCYLGPAPLESMARQILDAAGPSGANRDYLLQLDRCLREAGVVEAETRALAERVSLLMATHQRSIASKLS